MAKRQGIRMTVRILVNAVIKKQKKSLCAIFFLVMVSILSASLALTVYTGSSSVLHQEMERLGYGTLTAWVSGASQTEDSVFLKTELESLDAVDHVDVQPLIFSGYYINDSHSDTEGELLAYQPGEYDYRFFNADLDDYQDDVQISSGEVYLSPAMKSAYGAEIGDEIRFELSRENAGVAFTVAGFFEDPFMGSSMVDMKSFLVSEENYAGLLTTLENTSEFNILGRQGAMLHVFQDSVSELTITELNQELNEQTSLGQYSEMMYSEDTIFGFMVLLQNILAGFLAAFSILLLAVILIVLANTIQNTLEQEYAEIGIFKTLGLTGRTIRTALSAQYLIPAAAGILAGFLLTIPAALLARNLTITSTGVRMSAALRVPLLAGLYAAVAVVVFLFVLFQTRTVLKIRPMEAITGKQTGSFTGTGIRKKRKRENRRNRLSPKSLGLSLALRQLLSGRRRYAGVLLVTALLTLFAVVVEKMDAWIGPNGEGLMDSFSVAEHDIGIQPTTSDFDMEAMENRIRSFSSITDEYQIAMQNGSVNGVDYTINVLDQPSWFHILEGCTVESENEILVTEFVAGDLGVSIGDTVSVSSEGNTGEYTIIGIYECANSMGANVGMSREGYARIGDVTADIWCHHYILEDGDQRDAVMDALTENYRLEADIHDNSWSGLDGIVGVLHLVVALMYAVTGVVICVVVALSGHRVLLAEQKELAIYRSVGFSVKRLRFSFGLRYGLTAVCGVAAGMVLALAAADRAVAVILFNFGIGGFHCWSGTAAFLLPAAVITSLAFVFSWLLAGRIRRVSVTELLRNND